MSNAGIVMRAEDPVARHYAKKLGIGLAVAADWALQWERTLFVAAGTCVPWDLVGAGFGFLERWDAAAPLWRYGATAGTIGTPADQKRTQAITHDLRLMVYAHELLFVRNSEAGQALISTWLAEHADGGDARLAFLRAMYIVKPIFCALPRSWLADLAQRERSDQKAMLISRERHFAEPLIRVEIAPGRFVQCHARDKEKILAQYKIQQMGRRHGR
jgi:hypothetical protein